MKHANPERGAALIMALLAMALASTLATMLLWRQDVWLRQVEAQRDLAQIRLITTAGLDWARAVLAFDARTSSFDYAGEPWATRVPATKVEEGEISGAISDESGKWNLNNIVRNGRVSVADFEVFRRLLASLRLPENLASTLADWIDTDSEPLPDGAEDSYYLGLSPPYRTAGQPLNEVDGLLHVRGFTPELVEQLRPYVSALPRYNPVNLNTASAIVLSALLPSMSVSEVQQIVATRDRIPFRNVADLQLRLPRPEAAAGAGPLDTRSSYFTVRVNARYRRASTVTEVLMERQPNDWPRIVWQKFE